VSHNAFVHHHGGPARRNWRLEKAGPRAPHQITEVMNRADLNFGGERERITKTLSVTLAVCMGCAAFYRRRRRCASRHNFRRSLRHVNSCRAADLMYAMNEITAILRKRSVARFA